MFIKPITKTAWSEILKLQTEVYHSVDPESFEVLQDKWLRSPTNCFIYREDNKLMGYLLAHSWDSKLPPKLFHQLPEGTEGEILFLHDLAISTSALGKGIGSKLVEHLVKVATAEGYNEILLVSVQDSKVFWQKKGFITLSQEVCITYGEDAQLMKRALLA